MIVAVLIASDVTDDSLVAREIATLGGAIGRLHIARNAP